MRGVARYLMTTHYEPFTELLHTVRTGEVAATRYLGKPLFDWVNESPRRAELQNGAMGGFTSTARGNLLDVFPLPAGETVADIGGADGTLLVELLARYPDRRGIVFDLPNVVKDATSTLAAAGLRERATVVGGDFFESVPSGDVYLLSAVVHDWDDAAVTRILRTVARSAPEGARLVLVELVVPEDDSPHAAKFVDLTMMAMLGGRERTESQWRRLLADGGFTVDRVVAGSGLHSAIEATLRRN